MRFLFILVISNCVFFRALAQEPLERIRVNVQNAQSWAIEWQNEGLDVLEGSVRSESLELIVTPSTRSELERAGFFLESLEFGRAGAVPTGYLDLNQINAALAAAAMNFPTLCQVVNLTQEFGAPSTAEGRDIFAVKISDSVDLDEDEPVFLLVSDHHAREIVTPVIALHVMDQLLNLYGVDTNVTRYVNSHEIWIAPVWNPDGYNYVFTGDNLWRKNRRVFAQGTGVDINRNYNFGWDSACGGSSLVGSETYRGPSAGSEAETELMELFSSNRQFSKVLDFHSSGRETLFAYQQSCNLHVHQGYWQSGALALSQAGGYGTSVRGPSANGEHYHWQMWAYGNYAFLMETHTEFQPSFASAQAEAAQLWPAVALLLDQEPPLWGHVRDSQTGDPIVADISNLTDPALNGELQQSNFRFGRYQIWVPDGSYDFRFSADGYQSQTVQVTLVNGTPLQREIFMGPICVGDFGTSIGLDVADGSQIVNAFGQNGGPEDLDSSGLVDLTDLALWLEAWPGSCLD
ncbi:MAG: hypothetical protein KDC71_16545 [Acidobacteria bacterium]|nr:hypothetical protein [Acidobacteriota bacterium]